MADELLSGGAYGNTETRSALYGPHYVTPDIGAWIFMRDDFQLRYLRTTNKGVTRVSTRFDDGSLAGHAHGVWFDRERPNDYGRSIHVAWVQDGGNVYYRNLDITNDILGTQALVGDVGSVGGDEDNYCITITKTRSGNLIIAGLFAGAVVAGFAFKSIDGGASWSSIANPFEAAGDQGYLFPANTGDDDDAALLYFDDSSSQISVKMYDDDLNTWTETVVRSSIDLDGNIPNIMWDAALRWSDGFIIYSALSAFASATGDILTGTVNPNSIASPGIANTANVLTDTITTSTTVVVDQNNDDVYIGYSRGTASSSLGVYYKKSTDDLATFGSENAYSTTLTYRVRNLRGTRSITNRGGRVQFSWYADVLLDDYTNLTDVEISATQVDIAPPTALAVSVVLPTPTIVRNQLISPSAVAVPLVITEPLVGLRIFPTPAQLPVSIPAPSISSTYSLSPTPVAVPLVVPEPEIRQPRVQTAGDTGIFILRPDLTEVPGLAGPLTALSWETHRFVNQVGSWKAVVPVDDQLIDRVPLQRQLTRGWRISMMQENNNPRFKLVERWLMYQGVLQQRDYHIDVSGTSRLELSGSFRSVLLNDRLTLHGLEYDGESFAEAAEDLVDGTNIIGSPGGVILPADAVDIPLHVTFDDLTRLGALLYAANYARLMMRESWEFDKPEFVHIDGPPYSGIRLVAQEQAGVALQEAANIGIGIIGDLPRIEYKGDEIANRIIPLGSDFDEDDFLTLGDLRVGEDGDVDGIDWQNYIDFPVQVEQNPDGSDYHFIEDPVSIADHGRVDLRLINTAIKNPSDDDETRRATAAVLYAYALGELLQRRSEWEFIHIPIANGSQIWALPGSTVRLQYTGKVRSRDGSVTWFERDKFYLITERHDYSDPSGVRRVEFVLSAPVIEYVIPDLPDPVDEGDETPRTLPPRGGFQAPAPPASPAPPPAPPVTFNPCCDDPNVDVPGDPDDPVPPPQPPPQHAIGVNLGVGIDHPENFTGENPMNPGPTFYWGNNPEMHDPNLGIEITVAGDYVISTGMVVLNGPGIPGQEDITGYTLRVYAGGNLVIEFVNGFWPVGETREFFKSVMVRGLQVGDKVRWDHQLQFDTFFQMSPGAIGAGVTDPNASWISAYQVINAPCQPLLGEDCS